MQKHRIKLPISEKLFWTMGNQNLNMGRAIAEFVDNSYDARLGSTTVYVEIQEESIQIKDTSSGMDLNELKEALIPAESRERIDSVGGYGFGLKTASAFLGDCLEILTTTSDMKVALYLRIENPFNSQTDISQYKFNGNWEIDVIEVPKTFPHGTLITNSNLRRPRHKNDLENVKAHFSKTFSKFLERGEFSLIINGEPVEPYKFDVYCKRDFKFVVPNKYGEDCEVEGWVGVSKSLFKSTTAETNNGYHLYLNGRLLDYNRWIGLDRHPEMRLLVGEIYLKGFKSNITKTEIISDSYEYLMFEEQFKDWLKEKGIRKWIDEKTKEWTQKRKKAKKSDSSNKKVIEDKGMGPYDKEQEQPLDNSNKPENYIDSKVKQQGDKSKQNAVNESPEGNGGEIYAQTNPLSNGTNQATIKVIRNGRNHIEKMDLDVKKAKWTVIFEKNGRFNQFCDINHHDREMTLDSNHTFCQRYLDYVRNNGQNSSKQVLYILFAIFDDDSLRKIGHTLVEKLNDIIFFRGER